MAQSLSTFCANPIRYFFGTTLSGMRDSEKMLFAIASICALGAVLCFFLSGALYGAKSFPFSAEAFLFSGIGSAAASGYLFYKIKQRTALSQLSFISDSDSLDILYPVDGILIEVDKGLIAETPMEHLYQLSIFLIEAMERGYAPNLIVNFSGQIGTDGGGLTKDFLDDLFSALVRHSELRFICIENTSLKVPSCERREEAKKEIFWRMGQVMAWCSRERHLIGRHFDPSVFSVAFSLTSREMKIPLERFTLERKLELYHILLDAQQDQSHNMLLELLSLPMWERAHVRSAAELAFYANHLPEDFIFGGKIDYEKISSCSKNEKKVRESLIGMACSFFDPQIRGIQAIASGMHFVFSDWNMFCFGKNGLLFSESLQGKLDKAFIADSIHYLGNSLCVKKKVAWLKEWILNEAAEEEIELVIKFISGSSGMSEDSMITVTEQNTDSSLPFPRAHTCNNQIDLAPIPAGKKGADNDFTKANFIKCLLFTAKNETGYSME